MAHIQTAISALTSRQLSKAANAAASYYRAASSSLVKMYLFYGWSGRGRRKYPTEFLNFKRNLLNRFSSTVMSADIL